MGNSGLAGHKVQIWQPPFPLQFLAEAMKRLVSRRPSSGTGVALLTSPAHHYPIFCFFHEVFAITRELKYL